MNHRDRAEILLEHLKTPRVKGNKTHEIECIIDALVDAAADILETRLRPARNFRTAPCARRNKSL